MILREEWEHICNQIGRIKAEADQLDISPTLVKLLIAAEDHRFQNHPGVDPISLCRAICRTFINGKTEGGSTIAMQLVRVITGRYERTISRKISEIFLALRLTRVLGRNDIPKLYLTVAYFGWKMNGLNQAAMRMKISLDSMSIIEAANIIARLKYPQPRQLKVNINNKIGQRVRYIINRYFAMFPEKLPLGLALRKSNGSL